MANYKQLSYGATGQDVIRLQNALNADGASLQADGIYGAKTQAAVKDYQRKYGLQIDGIAGDQTLGHLYKSEGQTVQVTAPNEAQTDLQREAFSYDPNEDPVYRAYRRQYTRLGKLAMEDTVGKAAALTGGYGNSYAETAGQQAYGQYLQKLGDTIPTLYSAAYDRYLAEGEALYDELARMEQTRQTKRKELIQLLELGYQPTQSELTEAGLTAQQAALFPSASAGTGTKSASTRTYNTHGYTQAEIRKLQSLAGITVDGIWGPDTQKAYQAGYRPKTPEKATAFLESLYPESAHGAVERAAYGPYKNYVAYRILTSDLTREEQDHLLYDLGVTQSDYDDLARRGLL